MYHDRKCGNIAEEPESRATAQHTVGQSFPHGCSHWQTQHLCAWISRFLAQEGFAQAEAAEGEVIKFRVRDSKTAGVIIKGGKEGVIGEA